MRHWSVRVYARRHGVIDHHLESSLRYTPLYMYLTVSLTNMIRLFMPNYAHFIGSSTPESAQSHYLDAISVLRQTYLLYI